MVLLLLLLVFIYSSRVILIAVSILVMIFFVAKTSISDISPNQLKSSRVVYL